MILRRDIYGIVSNIFYGKAGEKVKVIRTTERVQGGLVYVVEGENGRFPITDDDIAALPTEVSQEPVIRYIQQPPGRKQKKSTPVALSNQQSMF